MYDTHVVDRNEGWIDHSSRFSREDSLSLVSKAEAEVKIVFRGSILTESHHLVCSISTRFVHTPRFKQCYLQIHMFRNRTV